ncbi:hypothetical protein PC116_g19152 [Phytophthora cactorum]|nr:hypothetical protein PC114_g17248 [Phytophthora cactorum]KAG3006248.1 hypothetical protein PC119_g15029 [Phytophthora cactorum]KAG3173294.1 hypothetical protein PC128_g18327 [Phytophthora cactorum]KAG4232615.1 hypothetical protein PC116_g19152 [Phytophthora cactorum]
MATSSPALHHVADDKDTEVEGSEQRRFTATVARNHHGIFHVALGAILALTLLHCTKATAIIDD